MSSVSSSSGPSSKPLAHTSPVTAQEMAKLAAANPKVEQAGKEALEKSQNQNATIVLSAGPKPSPTPPKPSPAAAKDAAAQQAQSKSNQAVQSKFKASVVRDASAEQQQLPNPLELPKAFIFEVGEGVEKYKFLSGILSTNDSNLPGWGPLAHSKDMSISVGWDKLPLPENFFKAQIAELSKLSGDGSPPTKNSLQNLVDYYKSSKGIVGVPSNIVSSAATMVGRIPEDPKTKVAHCLPCIGLVAQKSRYVTVIAWDERTGAGGIKELQFKRNQEHGVVGIQDYSKNADWLAFPVDSTNAQASSKASSESVPKVSGIYAAFIIMDNPEDDLIQPKGGTSLQKSPYRGESPPSGCYARGGSYSSRSTKAASSSSTGCNTAGVFHKGVSSVKAPVQTEGVFGAQGLVASGKVNKHTFAQVERSSANRYITAHLLHFQTYVTQQKKASVDEAVLKQTRSECEEMVDVQINRFKQWKGKYPLVEYPVLVPCRPSPAPCLSQPAASVLSYFKNPCESFLNSCVIS